MFIYSQRWASYKDSLPAISEGRYSGPKAQHFYKRRGKVNIMTDEEENIVESPEASEPKPFSGQNLNRIVAILFVIGIYLIIFLKILVLD